MMDGNDWRGWVIDRRRRVRIDILRMPFGTYLSLPSISFVVGRGALLNIRSINVEDKRISMIDCVVVVREVKLKSSGSPPPTLRPSLMIRQRNGNTIAGCQGCDGEGSVITILRGFIQEFHLELFENELYRCYSPSLKIQWMKNQLR